MLVGGLAKLTATPSARISSTSVWMTGFGPVVVYWVPSLSFPVMTPVVVDGGRRDLLGLTSLMNCE